MGDEMREMREVPVYFSWADLAAILDALYLYPGENMREKRDRVWDKVSAAMEEMERVEREQEGR